MGDLFLAQLVVVLSGGDVASNPHGLFQVVVLVLALLHRQVESPHPIVPTVVRALSDKYSLSRASPALLFRDLPNN